MEINSLKEIIKFSNDFKTAVNLYLSLNKTDKVLSYIPTKSSINLLSDYLDAVVNNKEHATLLVGPYGKGKSHLLLVLLAILSLERNSTNRKVINQLIKRIKSVEEIGVEASGLIDFAWNNHRYLPVIINDTRGDLNHSFLIALRDSLRREGLDDLVPDTYYSEALTRISDWKENYNSTYKAFDKELKKNGMSATQMIVELKQYTPAALELFQTVYPLVTAGSSFNPLASSDVLPLYKSVAEKLIEDYQYSGVYIVFDEFSKFIEGLDENTSGHTMKLLQDMCELASESSIYITMVAHKSIKEYGKHLSQEIINAFTGIEGRIIEKYFISSSKNNYELIRSAIDKDFKRACSVPAINNALSKEKLNDYYQLPAFHSNFGVEDFESIVLYGCYPLNPIAAYLLLNISEKVAQNERTLFTFISNDEPHSLARFVSDHDESKGWVVGADLIYDYFSGLFKKDVTNELIHNLWLSAEYAISKCDNQEEVKLVKTLALILMINKAEEIPANDRYLFLAAALIDGSNTLESLITKQLIYKKSSIGAYVFKTKAGSALRAELKKQREIKGSNCNVSKVLLNVTGEYFIVPRRYNTKMMMTRYFRHEYMDVDVFLGINDANTLFEDGDFSDGKVVSLFGFDSIKIKKIKEHYRKLGCQNLVLIVPEIGFKTIKPFVDYEILQNIKTDHLFISTNEVLKKEIPLLEEDITKVINDELERIFASESSEVLFWRNNKVETSKCGTEENAVNSVCEELYYKTPYINNEMINRSNITTAQTKKARLNIINAILSDEDNEEFYSGTNQEATIYRALFVNHKTAPTNTSDYIPEILEQLNAFVDSCSGKKVSFESVINMLTSAPYGIRRGVLPIYLSRVFADRHEDLIVYFSSMEIQISPEVIVNICESPSEYSLFVSKTDLIKEKYIKNLNRLFKVEDNRALTDNRIKNIVMCMQRWFRALPQISRNTAGIDHYGNNDALRVRMKALKKMLQKVDVNPYEILFIDILDKFSVKGLDEAFEAISECKEAYDNYLSWMIHKTTEGIYQVFGGHRKLELYHLTKEWYEKQSDLSKQGLHSGNVTSLMSCIEKMDVYGDEEVAQRIVKAVSNVYIENWIDDAYESFIEDLRFIKDEVEHIKSDKSDGKHLLSFTGSKGEHIERYYELVDEGTGTILRNIIEDTLDEYDDLSVNDRVAILLEMIEKIIG